MSSTEKVDRIQVCFQVSYHKWQLLQENWSDREITETEIINALIDRYLERNLKDLLGTPSTGSQPHETPKVKKSDDFEPRDPLHQYIHERVGEIVEQNLDSYLDRHLQGRIETILHDEISRHLGEKDEGKTSDLRFSNPRPSKLQKFQKEHPSSPSTRRGSRHSTELKTAKELAVILGCSPSYITTLNRIGELVKRGWKDSGKRHGKRILYQPVEDAVTR